jgi:hypothetical protein
MVTRLWAEIWSTDNESCVSLGGDYKVDEAVVKNLARVYVESRVACNCRSGQHMTDAGKSDHAVFRNLVCFCYAVGFDSTILRRWRR